MTARDSSEKWRHLVDESCKVPIDHVRKNKPTGWVMFALQPFFTENNNNVSPQFKKNNALPGLCIGKDSDRGGSIPICT